MLREYRGNKKAVGVWNREGKWTGGKVQGLGVPQGSGFGPQIE